MGGWPVSWGAGSHAACGGAVPPIPTHICLLPTSRLPTFPCPRPPSNRPTAADDARTKATWQRLGFSFTTPEDLRRGGVTHHDLLHMDNTVQVGWVVGCECVRW